MLSFSMYTPVNISLTVCSCCMHCQVAKLQHENEQLLSTRDLLQQQMDELQQLGQFERQSRLQAAVAALTGSDNAATAGTCSPGCSPVKQPMQMERQSPGRHGKMKKQSAANHDSNDYSSSSAQSAGSREADAVELCHQLQEGLPPRSPLRGTLGKLMRQIQAGVDEHQAMKQQGALLLDLVAGKPAVDGKGRRSQMY